MPPAVTPPPTRCRTSQGQSDGSCNNALSRGAKKSLIKVGVLKWPKPNPDRSKGKGARYYLERIERGPFGQPPA